MRAFTFLPIMLAGGAMAIAAADFPAAGHYATGKVNENILNYFIGHRAEMGHAVDTGGSVHVHYLSGNGFAASVQDFTGGTRGAVTIFDTSGPLPWYMNRICVPFNNAQYDVQYGGAHDMDVKTEPGTPITSIVSGTVSSVTHPIWGWQIGIKLDHPVRGIPYFAYLHLGAVKPGLQSGQRVEVGELIAYSGGANSKEQLHGKLETPFGPQFVDAASQSSQPQTGFALMRGPEYGVGAGWTKLPDPELDPLPVLKEAQDRYKARTFAAELNDVHGFRTYYNTHGSIAAFGPPLDKEHRTAHGFRQDFEAAALEWDAATREIVKVPRR